MPINANQFYEPLYRDLSKKHSRTERENQKLKDKVQDQDQEIADLKEKLNQEQDANQKLRQLLFVRNQPKTRTKRPTTSKPRTAQSYNRAEPATVTEEQTLALSGCPDCATPLTDPVSSRTRIIEDIIINPKPQVTAWTINRYWCTGCHKQVEGTVPGVLPKSRLGSGVLVMAVVAKYRWNLPYRKIQDYFNLSFGLSISEGEIAHLLEAAAKLVGSKWQEIIQAVKVGRAVHCDETGWYIDGDKVWAHAFATEQAVLYEIADTRGKGVAENALGPDFNGTRISDCLGNYKHLPGDHQICWAHLTREGYEHLERDPANRERQRLAPVLNQIYADLRAVTNQTEWDPALADRTRQICESRVEALVKQTWQDEKCRKLTNRLVNFQEALFTCLNAPGIPPDNNHAERVLRKIVVQRKISGGNRSPAHAIVHAKMMSVVETLRLEGGDFVAGLQQTLQAGIAAELSGE